MSAFKSINICKTHRSFSSYLNSDSLELLRKSVAKRSAYLDKFTHLLKLELGYNAEKLNVWQC